MSDYAYERLKEIRSRNDLTLKPLTYLNRQFVHYGQTRDLKLRYYQVQGVLHLAVMPRFLLGDDCGVGKTIQAITGCCSIWQNTPDVKVIVLTTKSAVGQWADEFAKFTTGVKTFVCKGTPAKRNRAREDWLTSTGPSVLIMGYRSAVQDFTQMQDLKEYVLIADEATAFKNHTAQVHQVVAHFSRQASRVWALTATLIKNNLLEGHAIFQAILPGLFESKNKFIQYYAYTRMQKVGKRQIPIVVGYPKSKVTEFRAKIDPYFIGRAKHEVASELPVLQSKTLGVEMSSEQQDLYSSILEEVLQAEDTTTAKLTSIIRCQQASNHPALLDAEGDSAKMEALFDLITEDGDLAGEKVIVYSRFKSLIDILEDALTKAKIKSVRITGAEKEDARQASQKAFQDPDSGVNIILITSAASEAVNLQAAKAIVFYDSPWSAGDLLQILGRMIRIGSQHDRVYAIHLISTWKRGKTIDARVMEVLEKKMGLLEQVLGTRLKGETEGPNADLSRETTLDDLFAAMREDAHGK